MKPRRPARTMELAPRSAIPARRPSKPDPLQAAPRWLRAVGPSPSPGAEIAGAAGAVRSVAPPIGLLADGEPGLGQIALAEFLDRLEERIRVAADRELAVAGRTTEDCPYVTGWLRYYRRRSAAHVEGAILRWAEPDHTDAGSLIEAVVARVADAARTWAATGRLVGLPEESPLVLLPSPEPGPAGALERLGPGLPLESTTRRRMESALGSDFRPVRVHGDPEAASRERSLAFAVGRHVVLGRDVPRAGTLAGDAVLAHELAHVEQQRGTAGVAQGSDAAVERDATRAALGVVLGRGTTPRAASPLRLSSCKPDPLGMEEVVQDFDLSAADVSLLDELEGTEELGSQFVAAYRSMRSWGHSLVASGPAGSIQSDIDIRRINALESAAKAEGFSSLQQWEGKVRSFEELFKRQAISSAFAILEENETFLRAERDRYDNAADVDALRRALQQVLDSDPALGGEIAFRVAGRKGLGGAIDRGPSPGSEALYDAMRKRFAARFPVVLDSSLDIVDLFAALDSPDRIRTRVQKTANDRVKDVRQTRAYLVEKPHLVWTFPLAIQRAYVGLGIVEGSIYDLLVQDKILKEKEWETFKKVMTGALAIGLGLLTFGEGTAAVLAGAAGAGVSVGTAISHIQEYRIKSAAAGTHFDQAKAISQDVPSLFWLVFDIVAAGFDLGMTVKALRAVAPAAEGLGTAAGGAKALTPRDLGKIAEEVGRKEAGELAKQGKTAKELGEVVEKSAERHLSRQEIIAKARKAEPAVVAALQVVAKDEKALSGLLRLEAGVRTKLLQELKDAPAAVERLGRLIDEAPQIAATVEKISSKMPAQFKAVMKKYLLTRSASSPNLLRALADARVSDEAFEAMAKALATTKSQREIGRKFATLAIDKIADTLPGGAEGIKSLRAATAGLHPNQAGIIFEKWLAKNVLKNPAGRFGATKAELESAFKAVQPPPRFSGTKLEIEADNMMSIGKGEAAIVDAKHLQTAHLFAEQEIDQARNYAELVRLGVQNKNGEVFKEVHYYFSTEAAAVKNASILRGTLLKRVRIYFIDDAGVAKVLGGSVP